MGLGYLMILCARIVTLHTNCDHIYLSRDFFLNLSVQNCFNFLFNFNIFKLIVHLPSFIFLFTMHIKQMLLLFLYIWSVLRFKHMYHSRYSIKIDFRCDKRQSE